MLDHYHHRRWYRTTTRTDFCCFHLQLNQRLTAFLQRHKHKERTASGGIYGQRLRGHVRPKRPWPMNETTDRANVPAIYRPTDRQALCLTHYHHLTLAPYCCLNLTTVVLICLRSIDQLIVPIRIRSTTDQPIVPICLRSRLLSCRYTCDPNTTR